MNNIMSKLFGSGPFISIQYTYSISVYIFIHPEQCFRHFLYSSNKHIVTYTRLYDVWDVFPMMLKTECHVIHIKCYQQEQCVSNKSINIQNYFYFYLDLLFSGPLLNTNHCQETLNFAETLTFLIRVLVAWYQKSHDTIAHQNIMRYHSNEKHTPLFTLRFR